MFGSRRTASWPSFRSDNGFPPPYRILLPSLVCSLRLPFVKRFLCAVRFPVAKKRKRLAARTSCFGSFRLKCSRTGHKAKTRGCRHFRFFLSNDRTQSQNSLQRYFPFHDRVGGLKECPRRVLALPCYLKNTLKTRQNKMFERRAFREESLLRKHRPGHLSTRCQNNQNSRRRPLRRCAKDRRIESAGMRCRSATRSWTGVPVPVNPAKRACP